ncbi:glutathione S-transferase [Caldovatus sediminis]|uniref:Glutathione S-transferase n=1 Tax=Caldovatus sediminis TaxID=2041189 RepID=A0A8J3EC85_9PROT|nr:glutathione S-transferase C-terminal domain-containing protein [Caldovatus sediminis]GGG32423.1 glutathione S-transferase [Caldovatus sediminis]
MKLYYSPGACSIGIHLLLEEIGKPYETVLTNTREGAQFRPEFVAINPKSKVPTLVRDDGSVLTEYPAIAFWLARTNPEAKLLPDDPEAQARALEFIDYCVATMHMQGFSRIFRPANFSPNEADHPAVRARGEEIFSRGLALMDKALEGREYLLGRFSIADSALFYCCFWWAERLGKPLPPNVAAHYARMRARPAVQRTLQAEGLG